VVVKKPKLLQVEASIVVHHGCWKFPMSSWVEKKKTTGGCVLGPTMMGILFVPSTIALTMNTKPIINSSLIKPFVGMAKFVGTIAPLFSC
jgi:hypothetical protein